MRENAADTSRRPTKNEKRRLRRKATFAKESITSGKEFSSSKPLIDVDYITADPQQDLHMDDETYAILKPIFERLAKPEELLSDTPRFPKPDPNLQSTKEQLELISEDIAAKPLSKKKRKLLSRLTVSELKQLVSRPDVVEAHDVTSSDPRLLIHLKSCRNTVPVPRHWCHVRKYLQGKRGIEKIPYQLPEFIADTGIAKIRETILEEELTKRGKQRARERMRPKMGKIDIDYQVLHDAFFKYQSKPKVSLHGDLYFEGKEFEVQAKEKRPGVLSPELLTALGMTENAPPPWLINMQRFGPPPSYPNLKIPGLNAPLPPGAAYGYQPGGWGKPPTDDFGRPLYGDVFGVSQGTELEISNTVDKSFRWGMLAEESDHDDADTVSTDSNDEDQSHLATEGLKTPVAEDGITSVISGIETPVAIDLRKREGLESGISTVDGGSQELYREVQQLKKSVKDGTLFGSDVRYNLEGKESLVQRDTDDELSGNRKRKAEQLLISKKAKEFKF